jgi:hypothetical protein
MGAVMTLGKMFAGRVRYSRAGGLSLGTLIVKVTMMGIKCLWVRHYDMDVVMLLGTC